jgi:DNA-binding MarR family transcriptional regulator
MPLPSVAGARLAEILNISSSHVTGLVEGGELKELPNRQRRRTSSRTICRASVIQFLKDRRCL